VPEGSRSEALEVVGPATGVTADHAPIAD
jgi:hypothetical protein